MIEDALNFSRRLTLLLYKKNVESEVIELFENFFNKVIQKEDNKEALDAFNNRKIDIVVVDLDDNSDEKFEFVEYIRSLNHQIIILALSQHKSFEILQRTINIGMDGYLSKPIDIDNFINIIKRIEKKYIQNEEFEDIKQNLNLLKQYQDIADKSSIISKTDTKGKIIYANDNFCKISGYSKDELIGKSHNIVRHPDNPQDLYKAMWDTISEQKTEWSGILKNVNKEGKPYYVKSTIKPIVNHDGDILEYIALRDNISTIMNDKKHLLDQIEDNNLSILILIQIEDFDMLEKFYTISTVDQIEKTFGYRLLSYLPPQFTFENVYDLDNGMYALLTDFDSFLNSNINIMSYLEEFANNVKNSVLTVDNIEYDINVSISYSYGKHMLFEDAKSGLEQAIKNNILVCHSNDFSIQEQKDAQKNLEIIKMVKIALEDYKIVSFFQPIINNKTKEVEKYESLVRLIDEEGNVLSPLHFLNISKKGTYYKKITHRVLENSFKMLDHVATKLSINLSTLDIEKEETRDKIFELLDKHKNSYNRLVFELLEDENVKDFDVIRDFIRKVKAQGVQIAIDDFGAGYSNFERLLGFEPDILKIDGHIIKNIIDDDYSQNILETIVNFAKKQNILTIAEFVENEEIYNYLCNQGVDYSQGYFFGKPEDLTKEEEKN